MDVIAARVEALRKLRFKELPDPVTVTPAQAKDEALEDLDTPLPALSAAARTRRCTRRSR